MTGSRQLEVDGLRVDGIGPVDLVIGSGECLVLSGPSGAGKTRVLRAIADLDRHTGRVVCEGVACEDVPAPEWRRRVGMLAADSQWWRDRVAEHFGTPPSPETLAALDLPPGVLEQPVARLSSGERQRLALLRLLANRPRVLLLDEPTANLDPDNVARVERLVADYLATLGAAAIWVSHDPRQRERVAHRVMRLAGRVPDARAAPPDGQERAR